ncbi:TetR/AcrR family transcriptional regulator [Williamsia sp. CHRR-6]|uniref:TetR/AcrR family transcriptional regulator n=1 Tax=Williamsia sp. CHRR-6 TaxID=2835871 RepID=UPI001BDA8855|nr:TetR/AcrR family transcriptional regulator [Williamsia sp. CHRR-6]MBT0567469.1 TetR/AcrR family transcriptional regulator [Williamsia sp. CHRR-6]
MMVNTGRPRDSSIDDAILDEAAKMVIENGYGATTIDAVARAAGTTRPAIYRRYASLAQVVAAAMTSRSSLAPADTGTLADDLREFQRQQVHFFSDPLVLRALPGLIEESARNDTLRTRMFDDFLLPRRAAVRAALDRAVARGDITPPSNPENVFDLLIGPLMLRTLLPDLGGVDASLIEVTVAAALDAVGRCEAGAEQP